MAEFKFAKPGLNAVGQYQLSGIPYATSTLAVLAASGMEVEFPTVTRFVTVVNENTGSNSALRVGFSSLGITNSNNYFLLDNGESYTGEFRVARIYLRGDAANTSASVIAGLTMIELENLTTNWSASDGTGLYNDGIG